MGPSAEIFRLLLMENAFELVVSPGILDEIRRAPGYPRVKKRLKSGQKEIEEYLLSLEILSSVVRPSAIPEVLDTDPDDNQYLACAKEGGAEFIVSGDSHLLELKEFEGVKIVTPRDFITLLNSAR